MTSLAFNFDPHLASFRQIDLPDFNAGLLNTTTSIERLPTEPIGSTQVTLANIQAGSRYRIERAGDGSLATPTGNAEGLYASGTLTITLDLYSAGSDNNNLRILVRKASAAPKYQPLETQATLTAAAQSVYIAQQPDAIA